MVKIIEQLTTVIDQKNKIIWKKEKIILQNVYYDVARIDIN